MAAPFNLPIGWILQNNGSGIDMNNNGWPDYADTSGSDSNSTTWWNNVNGWTPIWFYAFNGLMQFNETQLNATIDARAGSGGGFNPIVGFTPLTYDGNIINGTDIGYVAANNICAAEYTDSHFCLKSEVLATIANGNYSFSGTAWFQNGPPGYTANADDCSGWTSNDNTYLGPFWNWDYNVQAGKAVLTNCAQFKPLMCCGE